MADPARFDLYCDFLDLPENPPDLTAVVGMCHEVQGEQDHLLQEQPAMRSDEASPGSTASSGDYR